jgi:hypothetical protein
LIALEGFYRTLHSVLSVPVGINGSTRRIPSASPTVARR